MATPPPTKARLMQPARKRANSWSCRWLPFSCGDDEGDCDPSIFNDRPSQLDSDLLFEPDGAAGSKPSHEAYNCSTSSASSGTATSGTASILGSNSTFGSLSHLSSIREVGDNGDEFAKAAAAMRVTGSRCDGPRCFNCGSSAVQITGGEVPDAQAHPLATALVHESFCHSDCMWTYLFKVGGPKSGSSSNKLNAQ